MLRVHVRTCCPEAFFREMEIGNSLCDKPREGHMGSTSPQVVASRNGRLLFCGNGEAGRPEKLASVRSLTGTTRMLLLLLMFSCAPPLQAKKGLNNPTGSRSVWSSPSLRASHSRSLSSAVCRYAHVHSPFKTNHHQYCFNRSRQHRQLESLTAVSVLQ